MFLEGRGGGPRVQPGGKSDWISCFVSHVRHVLCVCGLDV
jgi:hypothetical protein